MRHERDEVEEITTTELLRVKKEIIDAEDYLKNVVRKDYSKAKGRGDSSFLHKESLNLIEREEQLLKRELEQS
jgi:hypothetical protein